MGTYGNSRQILEGLKEAGIDLITTVPDINLKELIDLLYAEKTITHVPVGREEEGIGVCTGAYLAGKRPAMLMQNAGLMNSCNALTTTALQFGIPILLLVYYAGDMGDNAFHMLGLLTEPVLSGLGLKYTVMRRVIVFDGDGALWMNMGSLATIGLHQPKNLVHICWDNQQYESSGGGPTVSTAEKIDFAGVAKAAGVRSSRCVSTVEDLKEAVSYALSHDGPHFIWATIEPGRTQVTPLKYDELENKYRFIRYIEETEGINILSVPIPHSCTVSHQKGRR